MVQPVGVRPRTAVEALDRAPVAHGRPVAHHHSRHPALADQPAQRHRRVEGPGLAVAVEDDVRTAVVPAGGEHVALGAQARVVGGAEPFQDGCAAGEPERDLGTGIGRRLADVRHARLLEDRPHRAQGRAVGVRRRDEPDRAGQPEAVGPAAHVPWRGPQGHLRPCRAGRRPVRNANGCLPGGSAPWGCPRAAPGPPCSASRAPGGRHWRTPRRPPRRPEAARRRT